MTILNLNNDLNFELPFQDGGFDEYIRAIDISDDEKATVLSLMNDEFEVELRIWALNRAIRNSLQSSKVSMTRWLVKQRRSSGFG